MSLNFDGKVFFYCVPADYSDYDNPYPHMAVCLAEGFKELGIEFYSNVDYWKTSSGDYLFRYNPEVRAEDCSIVVLNHEWSHFSFKPLPEVFLKKNSNCITVYLDADDGSITRSWQPEYRLFDYIFKAHFNNRYKYPSNFHPWAFGLSNRIIKELEVLQKSQNERNRHILVSFRPTARFNHSLRIYVYKKFLPSIQHVLPYKIQIENYDPKGEIEAYHHIQWLQTHGRHVPKYYQLLKQSAACACFGGFFVTPYPLDHSFRSSRMLKRVLSVTGLKTNRIVQWDSWRFWESLAAGCASFHVDLNQYGCLLPVMPENWKHYVGVDLDNNQATIDMINSDSSILERIGNEGRLWAMKNYSPRPTAERFLNTILS
jgi:hypothetical protein